MGDADGEEFSVRSMMDDARWADFITSDEGRRWANDATPEMGGDATDELFTDWVSWLALTEEAELPQGGHGDEASGASGTAAVPAEQSAEVEISARGDAADKPTELGVDAAAAGLTEEAESLQGGRGDEASGASRSAAVSAEASAEMKCYMRDAASDKPTELEVPAAADLVCGRLGEQNGLLEMPHHNVILVAPHLSRSQVCMVSIAATCSRAAVTTHAVEHCVHTCVT